MKKGLDTLSIAPFSAVVALVKKASSMLVSTSLNRAGLAATWVKNASNKHNNTETYSSQ